MMNGSRKVSYNGTTDEKLISDGLLRLSSEIGPWNGKRRPQSTMDLWIALKWISSRSPEERTQIVLQQGESPDFQVEGLGTPFGLEATEVSNEEERIFNVSKKQNSEDD